MEKDTYIPRQIENKIKAARKQFLALALIGRILLLQNPGLWEIVR